MAIENTYLLGKNITLGCGFDLQAKAPLDSRQTVPTFEGLRALIIGDAAYEGMIVYDEGTKKTYQAQKCESYSVEVDGKTKTYDIAFREFGINEAELKDLIASETTAAMEFKGATATLPENPAKGDMWKVTAAFDVAGETTKVGDSIVYNGEEWFRIPSGDDIEDTWRIVKVDGTSLGGIAEGKELNLTAGEKLEVAIDAETGAVVYSHEEIAAPTVKKVGDDEGDEPTRTYIASIETDGYGHITGYKTATENVVDTNTTYEFEGQSDEATSVYFQVTSSDADAADVIYLDAYSKNEADQKVAKALQDAKDYVATEIGLPEVEPNEAEGIEYRAATGVFETIQEMWGDIERHGSKLEALVGEDTEFDSIRDIAEDVVADVVGTVPTTADGDEQTVVDYINAKTKGIASEAALSELQEAVVDIKTEIGVPSIEGEDGQDASGLYALIEDLEWRVTENLQDDGAEISAIAHAVNQMLGDDLVGEDVLYEEGNQPTIRSIAADEASKALAGAKDYVDDQNFKTKQTAYSAEGSTAKTVTGVTQNENGEVEVTFGDIDFSHDHDTEYKKLQEAIGAVETEANEFVDTVAQDANGEIAITTKKVDFSAYRTSADQDVIDATFKTKQEEYSAIGSTVKTVTGVTQNENGEVEVTFEDIAFPVVELPTEADFGVLSVSKAAGTAITVDNTDAQRPVVGLAINNTGNVVLSQTDDGLSANVDLSHDHDAQYKKLQDAIDAVETANNTFIDTIAQNTNGEISITTKSVDFTGYATENYVDNAVTNQAAVVLAEAQKGIADLANGQVATIVELLTWGEF